MAEQEVASISQVGARLRWARRTAQMSIADVAERTKVSTYYLQALEDEQFTRLPSRVHTFGFLKAFADAVSADAEELVSALRQQLDQIQDPANATSAPQRQRRRGGIAAMLRSVSLF